MWHAPGHPEIRVAAFLLCAVGWASMVSAQAPPPPEPIQPDRPDVTNGTHIVGTGLLQIEAGGLYTHAAERQHAFGSPFTARVGVLDWLELRLGTDGILTKTDGINAASGLGNTQFGAKLRLWADPGGVPILSILPSVNLPTADPDKGLGSGDPDYTITFLTGRDLGERGRIDINYGVGAIGAGGGRSHFAQHLLSASSSFAVSTRWNPYAEVFWFSRQDASDNAVAALDAGAVYTLNPKLALDGGVQFGVTRNTSAFSAFGGVSVVVGDVLGSYGVHARQRRTEARAARAAARH